MERGNDDSSSGSEIMEIDSDDSEIVEQLVLMVPHEHRDIALAMETEEPEPNPILPSDIKNRIDKESIMENFSWAHLLENKVHVPCIFRNEEKCVPMRMLRVELQLHWGITEQNEIFALYEFPFIHVTEAEAKFLNKINFLHCDYRYGPEEFKVDDPVIKLTVVYSLMQMLVNSRDIFLQHKRRKRRLDRIFGFVKIGKFVPYIATEERGEKYIPLPFINPKFHLEKLKGIVVTREPLEHMQMMCEAFDLGHNIVLETKIKAISVAEIIKVFPQIESGVHYIWPLDPSVMSPEVILTVPGEKK